MSRRERIFIEVMKSDRKLKASREISSAGPKNKTLSNGVRGISAQVK
jgi:hypothetical protein